MLNTESRQYQLDKNKIFIVCNVFPFTNEGDGSDYQDNDIANIHLLGINHTSVKGGT